MEFPVELKATEHRNGGRIVRVYGVAHACDKPADGRSRDWWWFVGDVEWSDGTKSAKTEIPPYALCCDSPDGHDEVCKLSEAMSEYLNERGEWCDRDSKHEGWYATERPTPKRRRA